MYLRPVLFLLFFRVLPLQAQTRADRIYRLDNQVMEVLIDEIGEKEIVFFTVGDAAKRPQRLAKTLIWKIVYANGDTEEINTLPSLAATAPVEKADLIFRRDNTIIECRVIKVAPEEISFILIGKEVKRGIAPKDIIKIIYADGRTEIINTPTETVAVSESPPAEVEPQKTIPRVVKKRPKNYIGLAGGGSMTSFYREKMGHFPRKSLLNWEAGIVGSVVSRRHYQVRAEFWYTNKGAAEVFEGGGTTLKSEIRLRFVQGNFFPLILKTGGNKLNAAIGAGGFYALLMESSSKYAIGNDDLKDDLISQKLINIPADYGFCVLAGVYYKHKPMVELRYTYGLKEVMREVPVRNRGIHLSFFLTL